MNQESNVLSRKDDSYTYLLLYFPPLIMSAIKCVEKKMKESNWKIN